METYLTKNGLLVVREDASFFTNNSGEFQRLATNDEVEYLSESLTKVNIEEDPALIEESRRQFYTALRTMEIPLTMRTYLTKNGILVCRDHDGESFFTSNSGEFRRSATEDEVDYLVGEVGLPQIKVDGYETDTPQSSKQATLSLFIELRDMEVPLWHYLWTTSVDDYTNYKSGTSCNGGDYSHHEHTDFFARKVNGEWEIRTLTTFSTSASMAYDELNGNFENSRDMNYITALGVAPYEKDNEFYFHTRTGTGEDEEVFLDNLLNEGSCSIEDALLATGHYIPERDSDEEAHDYELTPDEISRRREITDKLGLTEPVRVGDNFKVFYWVKNDALRHRTENETLKADALHGEDHVESEWLIIVKAHCLKTRRRGRNKRRR